MGDRIDFFGKYSEYIKIIHSPVMENVISQLDLDKSISEFCLLQCNYSEYLEHHPEEPKYFFELYKLNFNNRSGHFVFAFNSHFFKSRDNINVVLDLVKMNWEQSINVKIEFVKRGKSIDDLKIESFDMLQTVHYLYPQKNLIKSKIDYQLFKIIYPYNTLKPVLEHWDSTIKV